MTTETKLNYWHVPTIAVAGGKHLFFMISDIITATNCSGVESVEV